MGKSGSGAVGLVMLVAAIAFFTFALGHPEMSFPWSNSVTYAIYVVYLGLTAWLLLVPHRRG